MCLHFPASDLFSLEVGRTIPLIIRQLAAATLLLACAGCAIYEPLPLDPATEYDLMSSRGNSVELPKSSSLLPADLFPLASVISHEDGLTLAEANALALFHAPALVAARGKLRLKGAELLRAGVLQNPNLFLGPRLSTNVGGLIFPGSMSFQIPLGGRLGAEKDRAIAEIEAARCQMLNREAETLVDVRQRFIEIAILSRRRTILRRVLQVSEQVLAKTQQLVGAGEADRVALGLATLDRDNALQELRDLGFERAEARVALMTRIGILPNLQIEVTIDDQLLASTSLPNLDQDRLLSHLKLQALEARYLAGEHGLEVEVARQYPSIRVGPEFESANGQPSFGLGLSISLPLFDSNAGGIAVAKEKRAMGREAWRTALLELVGREALARNRHDAAQRFLNELRARTLPAADDAERALEARVRGGQSTLIETLTTQSAIARARLREAELMGEAAIQGLRSLWYSGRLFSSENNGHSEGEQR